MRHFLNLLTQEEKERILEMHTGKKPTINEQGVFSGAKAAVKGLGTRIKTGVKDLGYSLQGQKSKMKSPKLEGDITEFKSRCNDTSAALNTAAQALSVIYNQANNIYGDDYLDEAEDFKTKLKSTIDSINQSMQLCNQMQGYQAPYNKVETTETPPQTETKPVNQPAQTKPTQQPKQETSPRPIVSGDRLPQTTGTQIQPQK